MQIICAIILATFYLPVNGQYIELKKQKLTKKEKKENVKVHYLNVSSDGHHAARSDLWLKNDYTYYYAITGNSYYAFSEGQWRKSNDTIRLNSTFDKNNLPIKISFRQRNKSDYTVQRIAFVKDLNDSIIDNVFVYINNDSISCMDGDLLCRGEYKSINKIRVQYENYGLSSEWYSIPDFQELLQITVQTKQNLTNYIIFRNQKLILINGRLIRLIE